MKKFVSILLLTLVMVLGLAAVAMASEVETAVKVEGLKVFAAIVTAAGFGIALASIGTGIAQGIAIRGAVEGTARNPEASGKITVTMIIGRGAHPAVRVPDVRSHPETGGHVRISLNSWRPVSKYLGSGLQGFRFKPR
jgi:F-type H+-transporting ATPase subunit c